MCEDCTHQIRMLIFSTSCYWLQETYNDTEHSNEQTTITNTHSDCVVLTKYSDTVRRQQLAKRSKHKSYTTFQLLTHHNITTITN